MQENVDRLDTRKSRDFNLFNTSDEILTDQNIFLPDLSWTFHNI